MTDIAKEPRSLEDIILGEAMRYALLSTHYRKPLNWTDKLLADSRKAILNLYIAAERVEVAEKVPEEFLTIMCDDMNTPKALAWLQTKAKEARKEDCVNKRRDLKAAANLIGLLNAKLPLPSKMEEEVLRCAELMRPPSQ